MSLDDIEQAVKDLKDFLRPEVAEFLYYPFAKGTLTEGGSKYSAEITTSTDVYETVEEITIDQPILKRGYKLFEIEFGLTGRNKSSGATESVLFKWQASDEGVNWEDLLAEQTHAVSAAANEEETWAGRFKPTGFFLGTGSSFKVKYIIKSGAAAGETALGSTKNSSYIVTKYRRD